MAREFASGVRFAQVSVLPAAASNTGVVLEQGGKLWYSDGAAWYDLAATGGSSGWTRITSATTAVAGTKYLAVVTSVTNVTLPTPATGDMFVVTNSMDSTANVRVVIGAGRVVNNPAFATGDDILLAPGETASLVAESSTELELVTPGAVGPQGPTGPAFTFGNGSAAAPAIAPTTDPNTGFYFDGSDRVLVSIAGEAYGGWNTARSQFEVGAQISFAPAAQAIGTFSGTFNGYEQFVLQNFSNGTDASTDLVIGNDSATDSTNYLNLGINSTGYTTNFFGNARDGYLYVTGSASGQGNLILGTGQANTRVRISVGGGGSSNIVCDFDANGINLPAKTGTVTAPSDGLNLFNRKRANRNTVRMLGPSGVETALQPALFGNSVVLWLPGTGTTVGINFGEAWTARNAGTGAAQAHPARASTNALTSMKRATFTTGTTATGSSGIQSTNTVAWRGNAAGLGGFFFYARFGIETFASDIRVMIGLSALNAALTGEPSAQNNSILIGKDAADANWQIITRDGTTANKINTGVAIAAGDIIDFFAFMAPNSSTLAVQMVNAVTGASLYENTNITANLPVNTTFLNAHAQIMSTTGTTGKVLALNRIYIETDL